MAEGGQPDRVVWVREALDRYGSALIRYAARLLGSQDAARDVVQETFARLCAQEPGSLNGRMPEWLYTVCRNCALDVRRKEQRMSAISDAVVAAEVSPETGPSEMLESRETTGRMVRLLADLPENQREVIRLKFQHGLRYRQISEITGLSVTNVGFLIHTGIKTLRERMNAEG